MGMIDQLRKMLGLDPEEGDPGINRGGDATGDTGIMVDPPPRVARGNTPSTFGKSMQLLKSEESPAKAAGLEPLPPEKYTAYVGDDKGIEWSPTREGAKAMAEAALQKRYRDAAKLGTLDPDSLQAETNTPGGEEALALARKRRGEDPVADTAQARGETPKRTIGEPDSGGKAELVAAINKVATPPEEQQEAPEEAPGQEPSPASEATALKRRPAGVIGTAFSPERPNATPPPGSDEAEYQAKLKDPGRRIFSNESLAGMGGQPGGGGGGSPAEQLAAKLAMGSTGDPRTAELKAALEKRSKRLGLAEGLDTMASGADIVQGTHYNSPGAYMRSAKEQGDADVEKVTAPNAFEQRNRKFEDDLQTSEQRRKLDLNADMRAGAREGRDAQGFQTREQREAAEEARKQGDYATKQGETDASSETSANARATAESLYPSAIAKIPKDTWKKFSAADVKRVFGEISMKDFRTGSAGGGRSAGVADRFAEKQVQDYNKNRVQDRTLSAVNNLMGRLEDKSPIQGFDAAKGWSQAQKIPLLGGLLSGAGNSAVRGTEMEGIAQDAITVMQQISLDTSGKVLNEHEIQNIQKRLGLDIGQGEDAFRRGLKREFDAIQAKADRDYNALEPDAKSKVDERGLRPQFKANKEHGYAPKGRTVGQSRFADLKALAEKYLRPSGGPND